MDTNTKATLAAGAAAGYVLGRTKKGKFALSVLSVVVGRSLDPRALVGEGVRKVVGSAELGVVREQVRDQLLGSGRTALSQAADRGVASLTAALQQRTERLLDTADEQDEDEDAASADDADDADEADAAADADSADETEDAGRSGDAENAENAEDAEGSSRPSKNATSRKSPAKRPPTRRGTPAKKAPAAKKQAAGRDGRAKRSAREEPSVRESHRR